KKQDGTAAELATDDRVARRAVRGLDRVALDDLEARNLVEAATADDCEDFAHGSRSVDERDLRLGEKLLAAPRVAPATTALGKDDRAHALVRLVHLVVDHDVVEEAILGDLAPGVVQTPLRGGLVFRAAPAEATFELLEGGRKDEHAHRLGEGGGDLASSLEVEIEDDPVE